jgi:hypothetical protein
MGLTGQPGTVILPRPRDGSAWVSGKRRLMGSPLAHTLLYQGGQMAVQDFELGPHARGGGDAELEQLSPLGTSVILIETADASGE